MMPANAKQRIKWTAKMQEDVLECKRRALHEFNQTCQNGKRRGYVKRMLELWIEKGYGHLGLTGQNLCDRASYLEKKLNCTTSEIGNLATDAQVSRENGMGSEDNEVENAASQPNRAPNLHSTTLNSQVLPMGLYVCADNNSSVFELCGKKPGCLPDYEAVSSPSSFVWGKSTAGKIITIDSSTIEEAYNEISQWPKKCFSCPIW